MRCTRESCKGHIDAEVLPDDTIIYSCSECGYYREVIAKKGRRLKKTFWVNVYEDRQIKDSIKVSDAYNSKEDAELRINNHMGNYIDTVPLEIKMQKPSYKILKESFKKD